MTTKHFLLIYELAGDYLQRRQAFRADHLLLAKEAADRGELELGGALAGGDMALLLFKGADAAAAEAFAASDPYVREGLVRAWRVVEWVTVAGPHALTRVAI